MIESTKKARCLNGQKQEVVYVELKCKSCKDRKGLAFPLLLIIDIIQIGKANFITSANIYKWNLYPQTSYSRPVCSFKNVAIILQAVNSLFQYISILRP